MCYKGKCLYFIPVEHGCLAFAVISAIGTLIATVACLVMGLIVLVHASKEEVHTGNSDELSYVFAAIGAGIEAMAGIILLVLAIPAFVAFFFSALLCNGIWKRQPGQLQAYFIYGVVVLVLALLAAIRHMCNRGDTLPAVYTLLGCGVYTLCLWMVYHTHLKLSGNAVNTDHIRLVEQY